MVCCVLFFFLLARLRIAWHIRSSASGPSRSSARRGAARPRWPKRCSPKRERSPPRAASSAAPPSATTTPLEKQLQHSLKLAVASFDFSRHTHPPARHAGLPGLPRPRPARAGRGRDRRDRDQRAERHRDDDAALHAVGGEARPRPPDHRQQDRRRQRRSSRRCSSASSRRSARSACRSTCRPAKRSQGLRLLLRALGRGRSSPRWRKRTASWSTRWSRSTRS